MPRRLTTRERVLQLSQRYTQAQIADKVGVSVRTVRRWKNEGVEPSRAENERALSKAVASVRGALRKRAARQGFEIPEEMRLIPEKFERMMRIDPMDPQRKRRIPYQSIEFDVRRLHDRKAGVDRQVQHMFNLIEPYRDRAGVWSKRTGRMRPLFRLIHWAEYDVYGTDPVKRGWRKVGSDWSPSAMLDGSPLTDDYILDELEKAKRLGPIVAVIVDDVTLDPHAGKTPTKRKKRRR